MSVDHEPLGLHLIGDFAVTTDDGDLRLSLSAGRLILAYLALCPSKTESRPKLAAIVWKDSEEHQAQRNLRQAQHSLRADLEERWNGIEADRNSVWLRLGSVVSDHDRMLEDMRSGVVPDAVMNTGRIASELLADLQETGELFTGWLRLKKNDFENTLRSHLEAIVDNADSEPRELCSVSIRRMKRRCAI